MGLFPPLLYLWEASLSPHLWDHNGDNDYDTHDGVSDDRDGVETLDTPFGSRRYIPSWVSSNFRWQSASIASIIQVMLMVWGVLIIPDDDQDG